jgi:hypothetical protein
MIGEPILYFPNIACCTVIFDISFKTERSTVLQVAIKFFLGSCVIVD